MINRRIQTWDETRQLSETLPDPPISLKIKYNEYISSPSYRSSKMYFYDDDAIDVSFLFHDALILNLADDLYPGGCVDVGNGAQEESIFRRTNYHKTLIDSFYPIVHGEAIYSPRVALFKQSESKQWQLMDDIQYINLIACPALKYPKLIYSKLRSVDVDCLKEKIRTIIQTAVHFKHKAIIFGAMGCGAWQNPSAQVAEIFVDVLKEFDGHIPYYVFAILSTTQSEPKTIDVFINAFNSV
jgi:uncharacterized protein (TIGR02452 family)